MTRSGDVTLSTRRPDDGPRGLTGHAVWVIGQVLDPSGLDAVLDAGRYASHWLITAWTASTPVVVPVLALSEVRALRPHLLAELYELLEHPSVVRRDLDPVTGSAVADLLVRAEVFDVCAGHVVALARERGWPVITGDAGRLRRIDPDVGVLLV